MDKALLRSLPPDGIGPIAPGFYRMTAAEYHADPCPIPSLSSSIAKVLIEQSPRHAAAEHPRLNPDREEKESAAMDLGSVAHELLLGKGGGFVVIEADNYQTKAAREARDAARAAGKVPVLLHQLDKADVIAEAARMTLDATPDAAHIFKAGAGHPEVVAIWQEADGTWCRAMLDWWTADCSEIDDLKTSGADISPAAVGKLISNMGYEVSEAFYRRGVTQLLPELGGRLKFRFVFVETSAPYEVVIVENDSTGRELGRRKAEYAIRRWGECLRAGEFPGYARKIHIAEYPAWSEASWMKRETEDETFI